MLAHVGIMHSCWKDVGALGRSPCVDGSGTVTATDVEQLFIVSDSSVTASTHAP